MTAGANTNEKKTGRYKRPSYSTILRQPRVHRNKKLTIIVWGMFVLQYNTAPASRSSSTTFAFPAAGPRAIFLTNPNVPNSPLT